MKGREGKVGFVTPAQFFVCNLLWKNYKPHTIFISIYGHIISEDHPRANMEFQYTAGCRLVGESIQVKKHMDPPSNFILYTKLFKQSYYSRSLILVEKVKTCEPQSSCKSATCLNNKIIIT